MTEVDPQIHTTSWWTEHYKNLEELQIKCRREGSIFVSEGICVYVDAFRNIWYAEQEK